MTACAFALALASCAPRPHSARKASTLPPIYPDYVGVTIPDGIAPRNFDFAGGPCDRVHVDVVGSKGGFMSASGTDIDFDASEWHRLTHRNAGGRLTFTLSVLAGGQWTEYDSFDMIVSADAIGDWGLTYRRIPPGYEVYGKMGIYQRCLSTFDEYVLIENTCATGYCVNCHTAARTNPDHFTFHVRGEHGATFVRHDGRDEWLAARNDTLGGSMVYPYWHPSGSFCAYSTNRTSQSFHAIRTERIEVFDQASDVFVYRPATRQIILSPLLATADHYETYPVFSPDGATLYFCAAEARPIPDGYQDIRYNICRIGFDAATGTFGTAVDTIFNARAMGMSATHPRPSYDGRYIMFTMSRYGCFPIWHREADNWLLDLQTGQARPLDAANSPETDSWHNWSSDSRWFVFTSRRDDGLYTRLYIASVDANGLVTKPFMLPQRHPAKYYSELFDSYNTPDFTARRVDFDDRSAGRRIMGGERVPTEVIYSR